MTTDEKLRDALAAQLNFWLGRSVVNVKITVKDRVVTLRRPVPAYTVEMECLERVQGAGGVKATVDELFVELPDNGKRPDAEIVAAAAGAINWLTTVLPVSIELAVWSGKITLEGIVKDSKQKQVVELVVRSIPGITGIANFLVADPHRPQPDSNDPIECPAIPIAA